MTNKNTYDRAFYRICEGMKLKYGQLHWAVHKGSELRISENIFNHVIKGWTVMNGWAKAGRIKLLPDPETRVGYKVED